MATSVSKFDRDEFFVDLKKNYIIYDDSDRELFYVDAPWRFMGRPDITLYDDGSLQRAVLFMTPADYGKALHLNYTVKPPDGKVIAKLSRHSLKSLFLPHVWDIADAAGGPIAQARETPAVRAFIRRALGQFYFLELLRPLFKTDFLLIRQDASGNEEKIGSFDRRGRSSEDHVLNLSGDPGRKLDRRIGLAVAILLDKI